MNTGFTQNLIRAISIILLCLSTVHFTWSQGLLNTRVSGTYHNITIVEFFEILENRYNIIIYYDPGKVPFFAKSFVFDEVPLFEAVQLFLKGSNLDLIKYREHLLIANKDYITAKFIEDLIGKWEDGTFKKPITSEAMMLEFYFGDSLNPPPGKIIFSGSIRDKYSQDPVIGAVVKDQNSDFGTTTDETGSFEIEFLPGQHHYLVSYLGYQDMELDLQCYESAAVQLEMEVFALNLSEVLVEATAQQDKVAETQIGIEMISTKEIRELPSLLGEADVLKSIERLPGVNTVSEASAGFNVRGGNIDQNLILLDDGILFNASHALGFFSIINPDAIRSVSLYKGNIPAQYGGRLSSVLRVDLREGNAVKWRGSGAVSLASSRLVLDGPVSAKTSVLLGARSSYSNWLLKLFRNPDINNSRFNFNDFVIKISHQLSNQHLLSASGYLSNDYFRYAKEFGYEWSSKLFNIRWRYLINSNLSLATSFSAGTYDSGQFIPEGDNAFNLMNGISYEKINSNLSFQNKKHFLNLGIEAIWLKMDPERLTPFESSSDIQPDIIPKDQGLELAIYINDEIQISPNFSVSGGLRFVNYSALGPSDLNFYDPDQPLSPGSVIETRSVQKNKEIISYPAIEPRISANFQIATAKSIKFSYNRINQFIHLLSNSTNPTPVDIWQLSNLYFKPETGQNYSVGYFQRINEKWNYSLEGFYKKIDRFPQFKDLATLLQNEQLETELILGLGRAYGLEFGTEFTTAKWRGTLAYTYGRSEAKTNGQFREEIINQNRWYPANFDQPHQLNFQIQYTMDPIQKVFIGFTFKSGRPITVPIANYAVQGVIVTHFSERNEFRIPSFQRVDFGYTIDRSEVKLKGIRSTFTLSFINLLGRSNPYTIYFRHDSENIQRAYQLSILGTVIPSLNWNFTF